ncbi:MAG: hypothetical protein BroJett026_05270 [Betaproteobacteria bacterium]|nr:MAG: hypothetical protein BroJett026_05270 [Betaproteobacteria bacterium]
MAAGAFASLASPVQAQICAPFTDVAAADGFCSSIQWMFNRGITLGCTSDQYCPAGTVRRDQMAAFMYRLGNVVHQQGGNAFGATAVLGTTDDHAVEVRANGSRAMRLEPVAISPNVIAGSPENTVSAGVRGATIAGGGVACCDTDPSFAFESPNRATDAFGTVGGGYANRAGNDSGTAVDAPFATVGGGQANIAHGARSTVGGGVLNLATGSHATVSGGGRNHGADAYSAVGGGAGNVASGSHSTIPGGSLNEATAPYAFAAGRRAKSDTFGSFTWADGTNLDFGPSVPNFFAVRATGGVGFTVAVNASGGSTQFCNYLPGTTGWACVSDREQKENLTPADGTDVLERLLAMPVYAYNFKGAPASLRNLGPTAQDFRAAFGLGEGDTTIASGNISGVALAAIQGLDAKLEAQVTRHEQALAERDARIAEQSRELAVLRERLAEVELLRVELAAMRAAVTELARTHPALARR